MRGMNTFNESDHPRQTDGRFTDKSQSAPEVALGDEEYLWLYEGDDHEVRVVSARTEAEALEQARAGFEEQYGEGVSDPVLLGVFTGDVDDLDSATFVPRPDTDEAKARHWLRYAEE